MTSKDDPPIRFIEPITRVHNMYRIREVVNAVTFANQHGRYPTDEDIAIMLAKRFLSIRRAEKIQDRIERRARDHLLTASLLGLLSREGRPFGYSSTKAGRRLKNYSAQDECPKDQKEEAVLIDKILRLKLTNVYDLQARASYANTRYRPCCRLLELLSFSASLQEHQIGLAARGLNGSKFEQDEGVKQLLSYKIEDEKSLKAFYKDYGVKERTQKNITRNIRPLLDWCWQLGLIKKAHPENQKIKCFSITQRGRKVLAKYIDKAPIWFNDLGETSEAEAKAAVLLFSQFCTLSSFDFHSVSNYSLKLRLFAEKVSELVQSVRDDTNVQLPHVLQNGNTVDFMMEYDVPPESRANVKSFLRQICKRAQLSVTSVLNTLEAAASIELEGIFEDDQKQACKRIKQEFAAKKPEIADAAYGKICDVAPSGAIMCQYTPFERRTHILLEMMKIGLTVQKHQGQIADRCEWDDLDADVKNFFQTNPDILLTNDIESQVECKSIREWGDPLKLNKAAVAQLIAYQQYLPMSKSNSVLFVYQGVLDDKSRKILLSIFHKNKDLVFVNEDYLTECIPKPVLKYDLIKRIEDPKQFTATERILA